MSALRDRLAQTAVLTAICAVIVTSTPTLVAHADPAMFTKREFRHVKAGMTRQHVETDICGGCIGTRLFKSHDSHCPVKHVSYPNNRGGLVILHYRRCHHRGSWRTWEVKTWCPTLAIFNCKQVGI